jgi:hypothetical protein
MKSDNFEAYKKGLSDSVVMLYMPNSDLDKLYIFTWIFFAPIRNGRETQIMFASVCETKKYKFLHSFR